MRLIKINTFVFLAALFWALLLGLGHDAAYTADESADCDRAISAHHNKLARLWGDLRDAKEDWSDADDDDLAARRLLAANECYLEENVSNINCDKFLKNIKAAERAARLANERKAQVTKRQHEVRKKLVGAMRRCGQTPPKDLTDRIREGEIAEKEAAEAEKNKAPERGWGEAVFDVFVDGLIREKGKAEGKKPKATPADKTKKAEKGKAEAKAGVSPPDDTSPGPSTGSKGDAVSTKPTDGTSAGSDTGSKEDAVPATVPKRKTKEEVAAIVRGRCQEKLKTRRARAVYRNGKWRCIFPRRTQHEKDAFTSCRDSFGKGSLPNLIQSSYKTYVCYCIDGYRMNASKTRCLPKQKTAKADPTKGSGSGSGSGRTSGGGGGTGGGTSGGIGGGTGGPTAGGGPCPPQVRGWVLPAGTRCVASSGPTKPTGVAAAKPPMPTGGATSRPQTPPPSAGGGECVEGDALVRIDCVQ